MLTDELSGLISNIYPANIFIYLRYLPVCIYQLIYDKMYFSFLTY